MTLGKKVAFNTIVQIVGRLLGLMLMLVTLNYISNHLIVDGSALVGYGQYTIVFAYASLIGAAADLGLFSLLVRDITHKSRQEVENLLGNALGFRLVLMLIIFVVAALLYPLMPYSPEVRVGILFGVLIAFSLLFSQTIAAIFQVNLMSERIVVAETIGRIFVMIGTIWVLQQGGGVLSVVWAHLFGYAVTIIVSYWLARPLARIPIRFNLELWKATLPQFSTIAAITILSLTHSRIDSVMLSLYKNEAEVGLYGLSYKIFEIVVIIPSIFASNLLPVITDYFVKDQKEKFQRVLKQSASILLFIALLVSFLVWLLAPYLIVFISQLEFLPSELPLRILMSSIAFVFVASMLIQAVIAAREQRRLILGYGIVVVLNILLNLYAIPRYSYTGAAITTVVTEAVLALFIVVIAYKHIHFSLDWPTVAKVILAASGVGLLVTFFQQGFMVSLDQFAQMGKLMQAFYIIAATLPFLGLFTGAAYIVTSGALFRLKGPADKGKAAS